MVAAGKLLLLGVLALLALAPSEAGVFRWIDSAGHTHYSDRPQPGAQELKLNKLAAPYYYVQRVYDGDTLLLKGDIRVRLLGIDTPEIEGRYRLEQAGGSSARDWLRQRIEGQKVRLEFDQERHDHYQRLLAHVFTVGGEHLNLLLVEEGLAVVSIFPPNFKYGTQLARAQDRAEADRRGLWSMPDYVPQPILAIPREGYQRGWRRYQGTPVAIRSSRKYARLVFSKQVEVRIPQAQLDLFGKLERYLEKQLEVRGWVSRRKENYSILVRHPSGLKLLF
ncbi:putative nuclease domain protein [Nitrosococcus oceani AFC27]|nr:putative nuclease domain protein [Nitrosococcus oceani AFC27]